MTLVIVLFCLVTLIITGLLAVLQQKTTLDFEKIVLPQFAPALGFLLMIFVFSDFKTPITIDFNSLVSIKGLLALIIPTGLFLIVFFICKMIKIDVKITWNMAQILPLMIIGMLIGSLGEEIGWRSFLQPTLEKKHTILLSSIIVGCVWGLWHIGHYKNGIVFMSGFLLFTISASIILSWIMRDTNYNLLLATFFHLSINIGFLLFFKSSLSNPKMILVNGVIWLIPAIIVAFTTGNEMVKL